MFKINQFLLMAVLPSGVNGAFVKQVKNTTVTFEHVHAAVPILHLKREASIVQETGYKWRTAPRNRFMSQVG